MRFPALVDLDDIAADSGGFKIRCEDADDGAGRPVSGAGRPGGAA